MNENEKLFMKPVISNYDLGDVDPNEAMKILYAIEAAECIVDSIYYIECTIEDLREEFIKNLPFTD